MDFIYFLGRFHVLVLHLPIGIILLAILVEWISRNRKYQHLAEAGTWIWGAAALSSVITVILGYMHYAEGGFEGEAASLHRLYGTSVAVITTFIWLLRASRSNHTHKLRLGVSLVLLAGVTLTGHYGGNLTHGPTFLVEYAPQPLRTLAGLAPRRPPVTQLTMADPYHDVIAPMLQSHCGSCHNDDKRRGGLNLSSYKSILEGGESGSVIVSGDVEGSEIIRRITLPEHDDDFMPAEGKTPLTGDQASILQWWIAEGTPIEVRLGNLDLDQKTESILASELGLLVGGSQPQIAEADPVDIKRLSEAGFLVRQVALDDPHLIVSNPSPGREISSSAIELLEIINEQLVELNLADSGIDDEDVLAIGRLSSLHRLRLSNNRLTDQAIMSLAKLPALETLNVYGNSGITDDSVEILTGMSTLVKLYIWQTGIGSEGLSNLRQLRPDLTVQGFTSMAFLDENEIAPIEASDSTTVE